MDGGTTFGGQGIDPLEEREALQDIIAFGVGCPHVQYFIPRPCITNTKSLFCFISAELRTVKLEQMGSEAPHLVASRNAYAAATEEIRDAADLLKVGLPDIALLICVTMRHFLERNTGSRLR